MIRDKGGADELFPVFLEQGERAVGGLGEELGNRAEFLFAVQIVLYVGGIMVLFLFVIMLVNLGIATRERSVSRQWWLALVCVLAVAAEVAFFFSRPVTLPGPAPETLPKGNVEAIAYVLFSRYLLPFEVASILLLAAIVGSVVMAKKRI